MNDIELGRPAGHTAGKTLVKRIKSQNILRQPEPSFTFDYNLWNEQKEDIKYIRVIVDDTTQYEITKKDFDLHKTVYNYGNGDGYAVPVKHWTKTVTQLQWEV